MIEYKRRMINAGLASEDDFDRSGALKSRITFKALILPWETSKRKRMWIADDGQEVDKVYWFLRDKYGASFSTRDEKVKDSFEGCQDRGILAEIWGTIKIVRGSTYLNAEGCKSFDINEYEEAPLIPATSDLPTEI